MITQQEIERYKRQIMLPGIGETGQAKLKQAKVLIAGLGGLGAPVALYLCAAGVGTIGLADNDRVDISNLQRQVLYRSSELGSLKTELACEKLQQLNPLVNICIHPERITANNAHELISRYDLVVDATDNFRSRYLLSRVCREIGKPMIHGSIEEFSGQLSVFNYQGGPTYEDLFPEPPENCPIDGEPKGVFGALPGIIGSLQSMEVLKVITGAGVPLSGKLLTYNALEGTFRTLSFS